jgi:hypothetical protein
MPDRSMEIYQLKVTLLGTKPPIWRRLLTPSDLTLAQLHDVLQIAMGWQNSHLHEFHARGRRIGVPDPDCAEVEMGMEDERKVRLSSVLGVARAKITYTYDFGDGWEHSVVMEKCLSADPGTVYPVCTDGKFACPPEDCGGLGGYYDVLAALAHPDDKKHKDMLEWIDESYDPLAFSVDDVNTILAQLRRPARRASKKARSSE